MDIREPHSFIALFFASFQLINRAFGTLLGFVITAVIGYGLLAALVLTPVPHFVIALLSVLYSVFLSVVFLKLLAAKAEGDNLSLPDASASALLPTIYFIILLMIFGFLGLCGGLIKQFTGATPYSAISITLGVVSFLFYIAVFFAPLMVAVREQNPVAALLYSAQLVRRHILYVICVIILMNITPLLVMTGIGYGLYVTIPLYFADSFNLAHLSAPWIGVGVVCAVVLILVQLAMAAYYVLAFLNLDYMDNRLAAPVMPQAQVSAQPDDILPPGAGPVAQMGQDIQVTKASVKTTAAEDVLDQHLDQVYQPGTQDVIQYTEEDRMPTILFDDEMAKQMEQDRLKWEQEKAKSHLKDNTDGTEGNNPIKISK